MEFFAPWIRLVIFAIFTFIGTISTFILSDVFNEKYFTDAGVLKEIPDNISYVHAANVIVVIIQIFATIMCAIKVIQIPHDVKNNDNNSVVWNTHEAVLLLIAAGVNSNLLAEKFFNSNFFVSVYVDGGDDALIGNEQFHDIIRLTMIYTRLGASAIAWMFFGFNMVFRTKNQYWSQPPSDPMEWISRIAVSFIFISQIIYSTIHFVQLHPDSIKKLFPSETNNFVNERHLEFISENISDLSLAIIGFIITWVSVPPSDNVNSLATTEIFNTLFLGFYGAMSAVRSAFAIHFLKGDINTAWVPLVVFIVGAVVSVGAKVISNRSNFRTVAIDQIVIFYNAIGQNYSIISLIWKLSLAAGMSAMFIAMFSTQAQWFTFDITPGAIPNATIGVAEHIIEDVYDFGQSAFDLIKDLDPCRWGTNNNHPLADLNIQYTGKDDIYGERPPNARQKNPFNIKDYDITKEGAICKCPVGKTDCSCNYINDIRDTIKNGKGGKESLVQRKEKIANDHLDSEMDRFDGNFSNWDDSSTYAKHLKKCHTIECDVVLGVAIASEVTIFAGDVIALFLPALSGVADTLAWLGQMANRIAHNIITYGIKIAKTLTGLAKRLSFLKPLVKLLVDIQKTIFKESFKMSLDLLIVYVPLIINGALCVLIAFWRRENVHKIFQTFGVIVTFYIPLTLLNASMYGLMFLFPHVIDDVVKIIPHQLFVVTSTEHVGFSLLRKAYLISTIGCFLLFVSSLLDDAYYLRKKAGKLRNAIREIFINKPTRTSVDMWDGYNDEQVKRRSKIADAGWFTALTVSIAVPVLFVLAYHYDWEFVKIRYGPAGPLLNVVNAFHGHTNMLQNTQNHVDFVDENSLCGLIGKAVKLAIQETIGVLDGLAREIATKLETFVESVFHLSSIISEFEDVGTKGINFLEETWQTAEKTLVLIIPLLVTILITITTFALPRVNDNTKDEIERTSKQLILIGVYYNIALLIMLQQLFATISNLKLHIFYFRFESGPLVPIGFIASGLNAISLFSLYVNKIYSAQ